MTTVFVILALTIGLVTGLSTPELRGLTMQILKVGTCLSAVVMVVFLVVIASGLGAEKKREEEEARSLHQ